MSQPSVGAATRRYGGKSDALEEEHEHTSGRDAAVGGAPRLDESFRPIYCDEDLMKLLAGRVFTSCNKGTAVVEDLEAFLAESGKAEHRALDIARLLIANAKGHISLIDGRAKAEPDKSEDILFPGAPIVLRAVIDAVKNVTRSTLRVSTADDPNLEWRIRFDPESALHLNRLYLVNRELYIIGCMRILSMREIKAAAIMADQKSL